MRVELPKVALFYAAMSVIGILWIQFAQFEIQWLGVKGIGVASFIAFFIFILSNHCSEQTAWGKKLVELFVSFLTPATNFSIFILALCSSVGEEILFRGAIQNQFGLVIASILFGLVHVPMTKIMIPWTLTAMTMGFVLGGVYSYAGNLLAPILLHFLINFLNIWALNQKYGLPKTFG